MSNQIVFSESHNLVDDGSLINKNNGSIRKVFNLAEIRNGWDFLAEFTLQLFYQPDYGEYLNNQNMPKSWTLNTPRIRIPFEVPEKKFMFTSDGKLATLKQGFFDINASPFLYNRAYNSKITYNFDPTRSKTYYIQYHKDGTIDYFDALNSGHIEKTISPSGNTLTFQYLAMGSQNPWLKKIIKDENNYIDLHLSTDGRKITITQNIENDQKTVELNRNYDDQLVSLIYRTTSSSTADVEFYFHYTKAVDSIPRLESYESSLGERICFTYIQIPYSDNQKVSVVSTVTKENVYGNQNHTYFYDYTKTLPDGTINFNNFTGYSPGKVQISGQDNCIHRTDGYTYLVTESIVFKGSDPDYYKIEREYNRFHCLIRETPIIVGASNKKALLRNYQINSGDINAQSETYNYPTEIISVYSNSKQERRTQELLNHDIYGNITSHTGPMGIQTQYRYLSFQDTGNPDDFSDHYLIEKRVIPNSSEADYIDSYDYVLKEGLQYIDPSTGISKLKKTMVKQAHRINGIQKTTYTYKAGEPFILSLESQSENIGKINENKYLAINYTYEKLSNGHVKIQETATNATFGQQTLSQYKIYHYNSRNVIEEQSLKGEKKNYTYDEFRNTTSITDYSATGSPYTEQFTYRHNRNFNLNVITKSSPGKYDIQKFYDWKGNLIRIEHNGALSKSFKYSRLNNILMEIDHGFDYQVTSAKRYRYAPNKIDIIRVEYPNEHADKFTYNYYENTKTEQKGDSPIVKWFMNNAGQVTQKHVGDQLHNRFEYDGFGRPTKEYDELNNNHYNSTRYDSFGRITEEGDHNHIATGKNDTINYEYDSALRNLFNSIHAHTTLGEGVSLHKRTRHYDDFGRIRREGTIVAEQETFDTIYEYQIDPEGITETLNAYNFRAEGNQLQSSFVTQRGKLTTADYKINSDLEDASNLNVKYSYSYNDDGSYRRVTTTHGNTTQLTLDYLYDRFGNVNAITYTRPFINSHHNPNYRYSITKEYGTSGNLLSNMTNHMQVETSFSYRPYGEIREIVYRHNGSSICRLTYVYNLAENQKTIDLHSDYFKDANGESLNARFNFWLDNNHQEYKRTCSVGEGGLRLTVENGIDPDTRKITRTIVTKHTQPIQSRTYEYSYSPGGMLTASVGSNHDGERTSYLSSGIGRIASVSVQNGNNATTTYNYKDDRPINTHRSGGDPASLYFYANNQDCIDYVTDTENDSDQYNDLYLRSDNIVKGYQAFYAYRFDGKLISQGDSHLSQDITTFVYDEENLLGEVCPQVKTTYITLNGIILGRYVCASESSQLEIYGTDPSGSLFYTLEITRTGHSNSTHDERYYQYSDYGEVTEF